MILCVILSLLLPVGPGHAAKELDSEEFSLPAIAFVARLVGDDKRARYIIDFDKQVKSDIYLADNPRRLVIDLPQIIFSLEADSTKSPSPLASRVSYQVRGGRRGRVEIALNEPVEISDIDEKNVSGTLRRRLLIDFVKTSPEKFAKLIRKKADIVQSEQNAFDGPKRRKVIVIDPGHGGVDGGAVGRHRVVEKKITLQFAQTLKRVLEASGTLKVLLTRDQDIFVSLTDRVEFARSNKADLMISVHADSLRQKFIRGATVYTLSKNGSDAISRRLASEQNKADLAAGLSLSTQNTKVTDILIDLTRRETEVFSKRFASTLVTHLKNQIKLINNPRRSANFYVLTAPEIPSILLELGYLSNNEDEKQMSSEEWQKKVANVTATAIRKFFGQPRASSQP